MAPLEKELEVDTMRSNNKKSSTDCSQWLCPYKLLLTNQLRHINFRLVTAAHTFNYTGLAHHNFDGSFVTHFIFTAFLLLFMILIQVKVVTICDRLHFYRLFSVLFKKLYHILQVVWGLYPLA